MYARIVDMKLKGNGAANQYTKTLESDIIPLLRKQTGFRDQISLFSSDKADVTGISFWDKKEQAEDYNTKVYPGILKSLSEIVEGTPHVIACEVSNSTVHKIAEGRTA